MSKCFPFVVAGLLAAPSLAGPGRSSSSIAACIRDPGCHRTFVVAHRVKGLGAPENSRAALTRAVEAGVPLVKIDLRVSKDGQLFVLHDRSLERATAMRRRIDDVPSSELSQVKLTNGETVPRFEELYAIARGHIVLVLGFKVDIVERVADWIHAHGSFDDVVFFVNTGEEMQAAALAKQRYPSMLVMVRLLDTRVTVDSTRAVFGRLPEILHTDQLSRSQVARLQGEGVKVYMSAVRAEGYIQPFKYFWVRFILRAKPDFVQTDEPLALMRRVAD